MFASTGKWCLATWVTVVAAGADLLPGPAAAQAAGAPPAAGRLVTGRTAAAGSARSYTLMVPDAPPPTGRRALVVMLHGCTQDAADFMRGTQMNTHAAPHGVFVLYPEQGAGQHPQKCWNWYAPAEMKRDAGEVAIVAAMVREVTAAQGIDPARVYVAGMSAGAAMAANLVAAYPELFAAMAVHSGIAAGAAADVMSAIGAMRSGPTADGDALGMAVLTAMADRAHAVPLLVIHGRADGVVSARNAASLVRQWLVVNASARHLAPPAVPARHEAVEATGRYGAVHEVWTSADGGMLVESYLVEGLGHAWSGGDANGSFTDPKGPDASALILTFFLAGAT